VVIDNLDIDWTGRAMGPLKTDPPLVVDADAILTLPIRGDKLERSRRPTWQQAGSTEVTFSKL